MHFNHSRLGTGAAVLASALTVAAATSGTALAGQTSTPGSGHAQSTALPSWYHTPLTAAQVKAEISVPRSLDSYTGPLRLTDDAFTAGSGALAVDAGQALGHALAQGEDLQLTNAFVLDGATPSTAVHSELAKLAWSNVTSVTCEGYTDYGPHSFRRDQLLGRARATAVCNLLHSLNSAITTRVVTYGSTRPVRVGGPVNTHHAQNRRVVIDITAVSAPATDTPTPVVPVVTTPVVTTPTAPIITVPLAPTIVSALAGDGSTTLTITPPSSEATITGYEYSIDGGSTWLPLTTTGSTTLTATITGLTDGTPYSVEVRADSSAGHGAASAASSVTPAGVPEAPDLQSGSAAADWDSGDWFTTLSWTAPVSDGGSPITDWDITQDGTDLGLASGLPSEDGVVDTDGTYTITFDTGLNYCDYYNPAAPYTITAVNSLGQSVASDTVDIAMVYGC